MNVRDFLDRAEQVSTAGPKGVQLTQRIVVAGAPPPSRTIERVMTGLGWEFCQIYGLTETSPLGTVNRMRTEWEGLDTAERARKLVHAGVPALACASRSTSSARC